MQVICLPILGKVLHDGNKINIVNSNIYLGFWYFVLFQFYVILAFAPVKHNIKKH